jgi:hypothetical protein
MTDDFKAKETAVRRIFLRFNDQQDKIKVIFEDFGNGTQAMSIVDSNTFTILLYIPAYMLSNTEVFQEVHSFLTTKLRG